jgi:four helix bundle protein
VKKWPFEELEVWNKAMDLVDKIYDLIEIFPKDERYGLTDDLRRAVISIPNNIAEGKGMYSQKHFLEHLYRSRGLLYETVTCLLTAERRKYITKEQRTRATDSAFEVQSKLAGLIHYLEKQTGKR